MRLCYEQLFVFVNESTIKLSREE